LVFIHWGKRRDLRNTFEEKLIKKGGGRKIVLEKITPSREGILFELNPKK